MRDIQTPVLEKSLLERQLDILKGAADLAQERLDYSAAHDDEVLLAINIVEDFLGRKGRICYGGQAMNAHLPPKYKFYDPENSIPDYDFLTPTGEEDADELLEMFKEAGFTEIGKRPGMHEGTIKIYVNFIPVADVTEINKRLYNILKKRSIEIEGITYMDADTLRMMMYLELSRPRGEVSRWEKVWQRLMLINTLVPVKGCREKGPLPTAELTPEFREFALEFLVENQRVFAGAEIVDYYDYALKRKASPEWLFSQNYPVVFYSPTPAEDAKILNKANRELRIKTLQSVGEFFPKIVIGTHRKRPVFAAVQETACHAYNTLYLRDGRQLRVGSLDTLATLFLSLSFNSKVADIFQRSVLCIVERIVAVQMRYNKSYKTTPFPIISITCSGYQKQFATLLKEKVERIRKARGVQRNTVRGSMVRRSINSGYKNHLPRRSKTQKRSRSSRGLEGA